MRSGGSGSRWSSWLVAMAMLFGMIQLMPGDPATIALGPRATPAMREAYLAKMGLDQPLPCRSCASSAACCRAISAPTCSPTGASRTIVLEQLPYTLALIGAGLGWAVAARHPARLLRRRSRRGRLADRVIGVLSRRRDRDAVLRRRDLRAPALRRARWAGCRRSAPASPATSATSCYHLVLPAFAIGLGWVGYLARMVRASMLEVLGENHIRMARAFGLPERTIIYRYALRSRSCRP